MHLLRWPVESSEKARKQPKCEDARSIRRRNLQTALARGVDQRPEGIKWHRTGMGGGLGRGYEMEKPKASTHLVGEGEESLSRRLSVFLGFPWGSDGLYGGRKVTDAFDDFLDLMTG